jgi:hypothetical protein
LPISHSLDIFVKKITADKLLLRGTWVSMKRRRSEEEFLALDEAWDMLLAASPCPRFVARLLSLSKEMRRRVWRFLSTPRLDNLGWTTRFCRHLDGLPTVTKILAADQEYHLFVDTGDQFDRRGFRPGTLHRCGDHHSILVLGWFKCGLRPELTRPDWVPAARPTRLIDWYFVAKALTIQAEAFRRHVNERLGRGELFVKADASLLLY